MLDDIKSDIAFYESQDKEQLIVFILNSERENHRLRKKLEMLTGCGCYGDCDSMNGSCVDCHYENPKLQMKCKQFQDEFTKIIKRKGE